MPSRFLRTASLRALRFAVTLGTWAGSAYAAPLTTEAFSLELAPGRPAERGYFPMGFVRGDPALTMPAGFSQAQETSMIAGFAQGATYPAPSPYLVAPEHLRYYSLALPADCIQDLLVAGRKAGQAHTPASKAFGAFALAIGPDGQPYSLPETKQRPLAKNRDLVDIFDPATRTYLREYVRAHVRSRVNSPLNQAVVYWGLDNEWEAPPNYSPAARTLFLTWLRASYHDDLPALNRAWEAHFTAFDAAVVSRLPAPEDYRTEPGRFLDWYAFSTECFLQEMLDQARTMSEADPKKRGVVHKATQLTLEMPITSRRRLFDHGRFAELIRPYSGGMYGIDVYGAGDRQAYETNYIFNCIRPEDDAPGYGVFLAETNNHSGPGHQFGSTAWRLLANGAKSAMFFTPGFVGAPAGTDWDHFAMIDRNTGRPMDKWFYAARWAAAVHRTEAFWRDAVPAPDLPKLALLMPRRDVLLSESSPRNPAEGMFAYPRNHRWMVFRWLREQGYWVDVLPYEKITPSYLKRFAGFVAVGAEHLTTEELTTLREYVAEGGVVISDQVTGYFDQHHVVQGGLAGAAGVEATRLTETRPVEFTIDGYRVAGVTHYTARTTTARTLAQDSQGAVLAAMQEVQRGRILSLPFELGSLVVQGKDGAVTAKNASTEPTAGAEQYDAYPGEFAIGSWLAGLLREAGVAPAYSVHYPATDSARWVRVEQPYVDRKGDTVLVIGNRAQLNPVEQLPAGTLELPLPGDPGAVAWWAPAEDEELVPVSIETLGGGRYRVSLPPITSSGLLYLGKADAPLLGFVPPQTRQGRVEGRASLVAPHESFAVGVRVVNASANELPAGQLTLVVPDGWQVSKPSLPTAPVPPRSSIVTEFRVTAGAPGLALEPQRLYPLIARWNDGTVDRAVMTAQVEGAPAPADGWRLLSDNANYPDSFPFRTHTGASYRYAAPAAAQIADPATDRGSGNGRALLNGFGNIGGERNSANRGGYVRKSYARYAAPEAEVIIDLQTTHLIQRVNIVPGPEPVLPRKVTLATSEDGTTYATRRELPLQGAAPEIIVPLDGVQARFIKLRVEWPGNGGTLDEIEVWGK